MKAAVKTAACTAMAVAAVGIAQGETVDRTRILWLRESAHAASAFGPFVNANHGAAYVNLGFALVYYLAWRKAVKDPDRGNRMGIRALMGAFALVHLAALVVAGSVGNLLVLGFYPLVFLIRPAARRGGMVTVLAPAALLLAAVAVAAAFYTGTLTLHGRWEQYPNLNLDHWFLGNGLGSFEWRWPATVEVGTMFPSYHTHLENEYLQIFFEAGFPGLAASLGGFLWVLRLAWKGLASGGAEFLLAPAAVGEACRASVDFSFHVFPLVVCFLIVCALLSRADDNRPHHRHPETAGRPPGEKGPD
jgi:O-antigen ligase